MAKKFDPDWLIRKKTIEIPFQHLGFDVQRIVGLIPMSRIVRSAAGAAGTVGLASAGVGLFLGAKDRDAGIFGVSAGVGISAGTFIHGRQKTVKLIQEQHDAVMEAMNKGGVLQTRFEGNYPRDWLRPASIGLTHPIFYVTQTKYCFSKRIRTRTQIIRTPKKMACTKRFTFLVLANLHSSTRHAEKRKK